MPAFHRLPNVFAWRDGRQWYFVQDRERAPPEAIEARLTQDGDTLILSIHQGTSGALVRDPLPWTDLRPP
jgi:hypothetical protein